MTEMQICFRFLKTFFRGAKGCNSCRRSQKILTHESLLPKIGFDTAENGQAKVQTRKHTSRTSEGEQLDRYGSEVHEERAAVDHAGHRRHAGLPRSAGVDAAVAAQRAARMTRIIVFQEPGDR